MLFFYLNESVRYEGEDGLEHVFEKIEDVSKVSFDKIYFSTPSDFIKQAEHIKSHLPPHIDKEKTILVADSSTIVNRPDFPQDIGFTKFKKVLEKLQGKTSVNIAIINAMSIATGDHLIGMQAYNYWYDKMKQHFQEVNVRLFQINPMKSMPITAQWHEKFQNLLALPSTLGELMQHDAYIDLGSMLIKENFNNQPMIDFFLEALSIDPNEVPKENKRIKYTLDTDADEHISEIFNRIKVKKRPVLLFHRSSTTPIREMSNVAARRIVREIIQNSGYYVISAVPLEFQHSRFLDISRYSITTNHFASIISKVDAIVTVDTSTYHLADAFNIPTVALFTTIEPEYRIKYYPYVEGIMLEEKNGWMYGRHKHSVEPEIAKQEVEYIENKWSSLDIQKILSALNRIKSKVI